MVGRYAYHLTRHRQDAEDLAQETLLKVWTVADRIPADPDHRRAWLFRVCRNTYVSGLRKRRLPQLHITNAMAGRLADPTAGFEDRVELEALAGSFPGRLPLVFRLHIIECRPLTETARELEISRRTATRYWGSIRDQLAA